MSKMYIKKINHVILSNINYTITFKDHIYSVVIEEFDSKNIKTITKSFVCLF